MEGNFLSRYHNKIEKWNNSIENDPKNKDIYEREMSEYIINCMPYMNRYIEDTNQEDEDREVTTDNVFNCKETSGLKKKDILN